MPRVLSLLLLAGLLPAAVLAQKPSDPPKAVVLMIGDGFGFSHLAFTRNLLYDGERLALESLPVTAFVTTYSASNRVTDSGAAATAFSASTKTDNKYVGCLVQPGKDANGAPVEQRLDVPTFADLAKEKGWKVGYVTTTRITHATPAAFYGHAHRDNEELLALQLLEKRPDVALGGGLDFFRPAPEEGKKPDATSGRRRDRRNLIRELREEGRTLVVTSAEELNEPAPDGPVLGLFAKSHLSFALDRDDEPADKQAPTLARMTQYALNALGRGNGSFFLLVEGGRIDHAGHEFDAAGVAAETQDFDRAVEVVQKYQQDHPGTLIVLTADHATGGLAINDYVDWEGIKKQKASLSTLVARLKDGGGAFAAELLREQTGYCCFGKDTQTLLALQADDAKRFLGTRLTEHNGVSWIPWVNGNTWGHTGEDVPLFAGGPGAERFQGVLDNADIPARFAGLLGWPWPAAPVDNPASGCYTNPPF